MLKQRQVGMMFDMSVRAVGAGRFAMAASLVAVFSIAAALSMRAGARMGAGEDAVVDSGIPAGTALFSSVFAPNAVLPARSSRRDASLDDGSMAPGLPAAPRVALKLSPEQQKIAQFVAKKYRIAVGDVQHFVVHAFRVSKEVRVDPYLVLAVMSIESNFNPNARSSAGAQGLMQVLTRVHVDKFAPFGGAAAAFDPAANISVGSRILKDYLLREGSVEGALKSYVGAAMHEHDSGYGYKVLSERERIAAAAAGRPIPAQPLKPPVVADEAGTSAAADTVVESGLAARDAVSAAPPADRVFDGVVGALSAASREPLPRVWAGPAVL